MKINGEYLTQSKLPINLNEFIHFSCIHKVPNYLNTAWSVNDEQLETRPTGDPSATGSCGCDQNPAFQN